jgi:fluoride exporter
MVKVLLVALGGGLGSVLRYLVSQWVQRLGSETFPLGTLSVNVIGCLCIGVLAAVFASPHAPREVYKFALAIGVLGGFTTFSTFGMETFVMANESQFGRAGLNLLLTNSLCLLAVWVGYRVAERFVGV